jgi:hypothetical protein
MKTVFSERMADAEEIPATSKFCKHVVFGIPIYFYGRIFVRSQNTKFFHSRVYFFVLNNMGEKVMFSDVSTMTIHNFGMNVI